MPGNSVFTNFAVRAVKDFEKFISDTPVVGKSISRETYNRLLDVAFIDSREGLARFSRLVAATNIKKIMGEFRFRVFLCI